MRKIKNYIIILITLLQAVACTEATSTQHTLRADSLCTAAETLRYSSVPRLQAAADTLLAEGVSQEHNAVARNALAYAALMQMDYVPALEMYNEVLAGSRCEIERLVGNVGIMTICYRLSANREFFDARTDALRRIRRITEDEAALPAHDRERFKRAKVEFNIVSLCYFSNIGLKDELERSIAHLQKELEGCDDAALRLYARVIMAAMETDAFARAEQAAVAATVARNRGLSWLQANSTLLLAINVRNIVRQTGGGNLPPAVAALNSERLSPLQFALSLALDAADTFSHYGDGFMSIEALTVAASCHTQAGDFEQALALLARAVERVNDYYARHLPLAPPLSLDTFTYHDETDATVFTKDGTDINIAECLISIRREASCAFAGLGNKELSDVNREAYLDLLHSTRMNKMMESRAEQAASLAARLYLWALLVVAALVAVVAVLCIMNTRWRRHNNAATARLKWLLLLSRTLMEELPREMGNEEEVQAAVCVILQRSFGDLLPEGSFSFTPPSEPCNALPLPAVNGKRFYTLYITAPVAPGPEILALLEQALPYVAVAIEEGLRIADIGDEQQRLVEQQRSYELFLADHKRENVIKRVSVSIVGAMRPFIERMTNELRNLSRAESADVRARRLEYIVELTETLDCHNTILERWIKMRRGEMSLQIERFAVRDIFEIIEKSRRFFEARGIELTVKPCDAVVRADRALTLFMLNTLVENAGKFTPQGGRVVVRAIEGDGFVELAVEDSGIGLSPADVKKILGERVYDASLIGDANEKLNKNKGGGFGLMNCKGIIEKYRATGDIFAVCRFSIESEKGKGSRFSLRLPRVVVGCVVALLAFLFPLSAAADDARLEQANVWADSVFASNVRGDYEKAVEYAACAIDELNDFYKEYTGGNDTLTLAGGSAAELRWWRGGVFPQEMKESVFYNIIDVRNELAVAALATQRWQDYHANNNIYSTLYRLIHEDKGIEAHYEQMRQLANNREAAIAILLFLLLVLLVVYVASYVRHAVIERINNSVVLGLNSRLLAVAGECEHTSAAELAASLLREIYNALGETMCIEKAVIYVKQTNAEPVVVALPAGEPVPVAAFSAGETQRVEISADGLCYTVPLAVVTGGERVVIGWLQLLSERPLSENEVMNVELVARYAASVAYHSVVRMAEHYKSLALAEEEAERVKFEENRLHVKNMVMDNCLSVIKHETIYYPGRVRGVTKQAIAANGNDAVFAERVAATKELVEHYNSVYSILSDCAARQLDDMSFAVSALPVDELFAHAQRFVERKAKKAGTAVTLTCEPTSIVAHGDRDFVLMLFELLCTAALTENLPGELLLRAVDCGDIVRVELTDTRRTLPDDVLAEMFTPSQHNIAAGEELVAMEYLVVKEIVRLHEDYMQLRGSRAEARSVQGGYVIIFSLPK